VEVAWSKERELALPISTRQCRACCSHLGSCTASLVLLC